ncbi:hypothetical protein HLB23_38420 [Nocardia uniformis]|uniref:Uncharacterized protein n=1 Tax=Nocardia uniformis TaxID=53432 RepID=A0A849CAV2_9NOCA|nr:hypothetical protein [Nocardia uniformis]NNH75662.1 hypothetical protein [Nocardia uniformis]
MPKPTKVELSRAERRPWAYAVVRSDKSRQNESHDAAQLDELAERLGFEICGMLAADSDAEFSQLFASFELSGISALLVPSVLHISGWMAVVRDHVDVWTLDPPGRWPRHCVPGTTAAFIPDTGGGR